MSIHPHASWRWAVLGAAACSQTSAAFVIQGLAVLAGYIQARLDLSATEVGLMFTAANLLPLFTLPAVGHLLDRGHEGRIVGCGALLMAAGLGLAAIAPSYAALLAAWLIVGAGYSTVQPGGSRSVASWFRDRELGLAMGVRQAGLPMGGAAAGLLLPACIAAGGVDSAFTLDMAVALGGGAAFCLVWRDPDGIAVRKAPGALNPAALLAALRPTWMRRAALTGAILMSIQTGVVVNLMLFLRDAHAVALDDGAPLLALALISGGAGRIALAALGDVARSGHAIGVRLSMVGSACGLLALALLPAPAEPWALALAAAWLGFFCLGWYGPWVAHLVARAPPARTGLTLGVAMAINRIAIVGVPPLLGAMVDASDSYLPVWVALGTAALAGLAIDLLRDRAAPAITSR